MTENSMRETTIQLYGRIGEPPNTAAAFARKLDAAERERPSKLILRVDSEGGSVMDGQTIFNRLRSTSIPETVAYVDGLAASAASLIIMAADRVIMHANSQIMIHETWTNVSGGVSELNRHIGLLEMINEQYAQTYADRTGLTMQEVRRMMHGETWLPPGDAIRMGFADEMIVDRPHQVYQARDVRRLAACVAAGRASPGIRVTTWRERRGRARALAALIQEA
jgi:ATP-dependent protease ClpP protease subunit